MVVRQAMVLMVLAADRRGLRRRCATSRYGRRRTKPDLAAAREVADTDGQRRHGDRVARRTPSRPPPRDSRSRASPTVSIIRAGSTSCPMATCSSPRPTRRRKPEDGKGIKGWFMKTLHEESRIGAVPSANRITLLRDADGDGVAETRTVFLAGLNSPFGMALVGDDLYVANTDALVRFPYTAGADARSPRPARRSPICPAGRSTITGPRTSSPAADGTKLYVTVGSNSNVAENGIDKEDGRAAIWESIARPAQHRVFASGLRNPIGMAWEPQTRRAVDRGERARRARQRPRARLHDLGAGRRLLWLAVQLLRPARRRRA